MQTRTLGRTGLEVTVLGYGAMEIRGPRIWGGRPVKDEEAECILNAVLTGNSISSTMNTVTPRLSSLSFYVT